MLGCTKDKQDCLGAGRTALSQSYCEYNFPFLFFMNNEAKFLTRNIGYLELVTMFILKLVTISQGPFESGVWKGGLSGLLCSRFSI